MVTAGGARRTIARMVHVAALAAAIGCSSDSTVGPAGNAITLGLSVASGIAPAGSRRSASTPSHQHCASRTPITFTVVGLSAGIVDTIGSTDVLSNGTTTAAINFSIPALTPTGVYSLTVRASADGVADATAPFTLTVSPIGSGTFSLAAQDATISTSSGTNVPITITRLGFTASIALTVLNLPQGVTAFLSPEQTTGSNATLTLSASGNALSGGYDVTVRGLSNGIDMRTTFRLTIQ